MQRNDHLGEKHNLRQYSSARSFFKVFGPIFIAIGGIFEFVGLADFFSAMGSFNPPTLFWCAFAGMPFLAIGFAMTSAGYMGHVARYQASQMAPVAKDVTNYMVEGTKESIKTVADAFTGNLKTEEKAPLCPHCGNKISKDAKFCDECGKSVSKTCPVCNSSNDGDAKFCEKCGERLY